MGREKEPKGDGKAKHKATKLKKLTEDCESAGAGGDADTHKLVNNECGRKSKKEKGQLELIIVSWGASRI